MARPVFPVVLEALRQNRREMHLSEIAGATGLGQEQISSSITNYINTGGDLVVRGRRGYFKFVDHPAKTKRQKSAQPETDGADKVVIPEVLEVVGTTSKGTLLARDPDTKAMYEARPI